jgi:ketosteroid isomerase-like protein
MLRDDVTNWIDGYERAWRTAGTDALGDLFTDDASYLQGPYETPKVGLEQIATMWEDTRDGPDEAFRMTSEVVAVDGTTAVARVEVHYGDPVQRKYRDLWLMRFADDGRCRAFEEWPFHPGQPYTAAGEDQDRA